MPVEHTDVRLFYALWPDAQTAARLSERQQRLDGKKTLPADFHMTLAFLGTHPIGRLSRLQDIMSTIRLPPLSMTLDCYGRFSRRGIVWAGLTSVPAALLGLRSELAGVLTELEIDYDDELPFIPHITLARQSALPESCEFEPLVWTNYQFVLAQSKASPHVAYAPRYQLLNTIAVSTIEKDI